MTRYPLLILLLFFSMLMQCRGFRSSEVTELESASQNAPKRTPNLGDQEFARLTNAYKNAMNTYLLTKPDPYCYVRSYYLAMEAAALGYNPGSVLIQRCRVNKRGPISSMTQFSPQLSQAVAGADWHVAVAFNKGGSLSSDWDTLRVFDPQLNKNSFLPYESWKKGIGIYNLDYLAEYIPATEYVTGKSQALREKRVIEQFKDNLTKDKKLCPEIRRRIFYQGSDLANPNWTMEDQFVAFHYSHIEDACAKLYRINGSDTVIKNTRRLVEALDKKALIDWTEPLDPKNCHLRCRHRIERFYWSYRSVPIPDDSKPIVYTRATHCPGQ